MLEIQAGKNRIERILLYSVFMSTIVSGYNFSGDEFLPFLLSLDGFD